MRAPVQKTRPRRAGKQAASKASAASPNQQGTAQAGAPAVGTGRKAHVRNRLIVAVAVVAAAIAGAGAPSILAASEQLHDTQSLVTLAEQTQETLTLAHALADERDEVTAYIAAGRPKSAAPSKQRSDRVDTQAEELSADTDTSAALREDIESIAGVREAALSGRAPPWRRTRHTPPSSPNSTPSPRNWPPNCRRVPVVAPTPSPNSTPPSSRPPPPGGCSWRR